MLFVFMQLSKNKKINNNKILLIVIDYFVLDKNKKITSLYEMKDGKKCFRQ